MKKNFWLFCLMLAFSSNLLISQKFIKYQTWASERYKDLGDSLQRSDVHYDSIKFALKGFWNFRLDGIIPIPSLAYILTNSENRLKIVTLESQGYQIQDPTIPYYYAHKVNHQENLGLEECYKDTTIMSKSCEPPCSKDTIIPKWDRPIGADNDPYTKHPTIQRWIDGTNPRIFPIPANIKFAVSGNFIGDSKSEMMLFYYNDTSNTLKVYLARNNATSNTLNYNFTVSNIYNLAGNDYLPTQIKFIKAGDFDGDGKDEVVMLKNDTGIPILQSIWILKYDEVNSIWNFNLKTQYSKSVIDFNNFLYAVPGDFDGNGYCDLACINPGTTNYIYNFEGNGNFASYNTQYSDNTGALNFNKIQQAVSGNFNGDVTGINGRGKDELAIFYDHGTGTEMTGLDAVQEVFVSDHAVNNWNFTSVIKEHRKNLNFNDSLTKFAFAANFDCDVLKRDDLMTLYLGNDGDSQSEFKKLLLWTSLPSFTENDFIMDTLSPSGVRGKYIPVGIEGIRLQSDTITDAEFFNNGWRMDKKGFRRTNTPEYMNMLSKLFNTILVDRVDYTDAFNEWTVRDSILNTRRITASEYDFWSNTTNPDKGYIHALRSYLDKADSYHMKVIPRMLTGHLSIYDDSIANQNSYFARAMRFFNIANTPSFVINNLSNTNIENHHSFLGWNIFDEPDSYKVQGRTTGGDIINYQEHFNRTAYTNTIPLLAEADRLTAARTMHRNYRDIVHTYSNKPVFGNFHANILDFDYNQETYDIGYFDTYPFTSSRDYLGLTNYVNVSKSLFESMVKNNKMTSMTFLQGVGYEFIGEYGQHNGTPNQYAQRFSLFSQAIEGVRGFMYFIHPNMLYNDTLNGSTFLAVSEFNNYIPIFCKENLNYKVSTSRDRFITSDYSGDAFNTRVSNFVNYSLHYDSTNTPPIYYLFVSNADYYPFISDINYTIFVEPGTPDSVYLLAPDYFKNGLYDQITSTKDDNGNYIQFSGNMNKAEIKIYAIGGLPNHKTIADSINLRGSLAYSNQRKLIAYPAKQDSLADYGTTDTVRYHAVYHRLIPNTSRYGVYYRRSNPMVRSLPQNMINWEPDDHLLSTAIISNNNIIDDCPNCKYPSIVVRYDYSNPVLNQRKPKAYIVYTCKAMPGSTYDNEIVESIFPINDVGLNVPAAGQLIDYIRGSDMNTFGTPMICGTNGGNYYAYSDSLRGIVAAFKLPHERNFQFINDTLWLSWHSTGDQSYNVKAIHPSLNSYSRIRVGENDCALVWQEKDSNKSNPNVTYPYHIYMTGLRRLGNPDRIDKFIGSIADQNSDIIPVNNSIGWLTNQNFSNLPFPPDQTMPVIYRGVEDFGDCPVEYDEEGEPLVTFRYIHLKSDHIYWEFSNNNGINEIKSIYYRGIFTNTFYNPAHYWSNYPFKIYSSNSKLYSPNVCQGRLTDQNDWVYSNINDSAIVLNFNSGDDVHSINSKIWQKNMSHFSFIDFNSNDFKNYNIYYAEKIQQLNGFGLTPQLSAMPLLRGRGEWNFNRRLFETGTTEPHEIVSSLQYFYKKFDNPESAYSFFGFIKDEKKVQISNFWLEDNQDNILMPHINIFKKVEKLYIPCDTIYSDWFNLKEIKNMNYLAYGKEKEHIKIKIERQRDGKTMTLNLKLKGDSTIVNHNFKFLNAGDDKYRLVFTKNNNLAQYTETMIIGGLPKVEDLDNETDSEKLGKGSLSYEYNLIDFDESTYTDNGTNQLKLIIYPNPANQNIEATAYIPQSNLANMQNGVPPKALSLILYTNLGTEIKKLKIIPGITTSISLDNLSNGVYFIKVEIESGKFIDNLITPAIKSFVIQK